MWTCVFAFLYKEWGRLSSWSQKGDLEHTGFSPTMWSPDEALAGVEGVTPPQAQVGRVAYAARLWVERVVSVDFKPSSFFSQCPCGHVSPVFMVQPSLLSQLPLCLHQRHSPSVLPLRSPGIFSLDTALRSKAPLYLAASSRLWGHTEWTRLK